MKNAEDNNLSFLDIAVLSRIQEGASTRKKSLNAKTAQNMLKLLSDAYRSNKPILLNASHAKDKYEVQHYYYLALFNMGILKQVGQLSQYALPHSPNLALASAVYDYVLADAWWKNGNGIRVGDKSITVGNTNVGLVAGLPSTKRTYKKRKKPLRRKIMDFIKDYWPVAAGLVVGGGIAYGVIEIINYLK